MATGKGAGIAKSTILVLLWSSPHFGGLRSQKSRKSKGPWKWPLEKGIAKSTISVLLRCSPHFGGLAWKPEIQGIQGALEMAFGKGYCKIDDFGAFAVFPSFRRPCMEAGNPRNPRGLGNGLWKRSGYCKIGNFSAFVVFRPFGRPWKPEIQDIQGALEMATGKGAGNAKSTILVLLLCSPHFGGFGNRKSIGNGYRKRSGCCKIDNFAAFVEFPPFRRP